MKHRLATNYAKNYCNRTPIVKVIVENAVTCFFLGDTVYFLAGDLHARTRLYCRALAVTSAKLSCIISYRLHLPLGPGWWLKTLSVVSEVNETQNSSRGPTPSIKFPRPMLVIRILKKDPIVDGFERLRLMA